MNDNIPLKILLTAALISSMYVISKEPETKLDTTQYCEMVSLWHDNSHLPKNKRLGWPPHKGECDE